jgi:hypothetical protein
VVVMMVAIKDVHATVERRLLCFSLFFWRGLDIVWVWLFTVVYDGSHFMTDTQYDRAPGDASALPDVERGTSSGVVVYTIGLALAVVLTAMSFWAPIHRCSGQAASRFG